MLFILLLILFLAALFEWGILPAIVITLSMFLVMPNAITRVRNVDKEHPL